MFSDSLERVWTPINNEERPMTVLWKAVSGLLGFVAAWAARKASTSLWTNLTKTEAPVNPADRSITWPSAVGWATVAGMTAGLARVLGRRGAAAVWESVADEAPPGMAA